MRILDLLLRLLYPPRCGSCARELPRDAPTRLCRSCLAQLHAIESPCARCGEPGHAGVCPACVRRPPTFATARACFVYREGELSSALILRWKYRADHVAGRALSLVLAAARQRDGGCYDVVVPVPLHPLRLAGRGFNQAAVLSQSCLLPGERFAPRVLRRTSRTSSQAALDRRQRAGNVATAFEVREPATVRGRRVLLVDDVLTTGATARACAGVLVEAGAAQVDVWTLARTPRGGGAQSAIAAALARTRGDDE